MKKITLSLLILFGFHSYIFADTIYPITREMGSGTRSAFVEIFDIKKEMRGKIVDAITQRAEVTNSSGVIITSIIYSKNAIGYISLGSLNDKIKALKIDGVAPSVATINDKSYKISRPFNLVIKETNPLIQDFLDYAINAKNIIEDAGYISTSNENYISNKPKGKLVIIGSSSITPLMEKLSENYKTINQNAEIEILQVDSTTGVNSVIDGIADIGMVSRELKDSELERGIQVKVLAIDGLVIIVNKANKIDSISKDDVRNIFLGEIKSWRDVK